MGAIFDPRAPEVPMRHAATRHPMTLDRERTALVVIDVQERLFPAMDADHREEVMRNIKVLTATARRLHLETLVTEQYPKGLGHTLQEVKDALPAGGQPGEKVAFSCLGTDAFRSPLPAPGARPLLLAGLEAPPCGLVSALDPPAQ